jgi:hypothetical protein
MGHTPQLPRRPDNPENVRRLREDAERRIAREELSTSPGYSTMGNVPENLPRPAYGGPRYVPPQSGKTNDRRVRGSFGRMPVRETAA